jgi:phosphoglycerate dehydrogenase-like enzyme
MADTPELLVTHRRSDAFVGQFREALADRLGHDPVVRARTPAETAGRFGTAEAVMTNALREEWLTDADSLVWVQTVSSGVDRLPLEGLRDRGVVLTNAAGIHAEPVGEQVLGYMLAFERGLTVGFRRQADGVWETFAGGELRGKTVGVVGLGAIGSRVAELAAAFGTTVVGTKRDPTDAPAVVDEVYPPDGLHEVIGRADYLVLACPLTDETRGLVGQAELELLGEEAVLVNVARGEVVDETALTRALQSHTIGGAALDVFETEPLPADSPLWDLSNVIVTPHMAGSSPHAADRLVDIVADNYEAFAAGDRAAMRNRVR